MAPDGSRLATTSHDRTCRIWDLPSGQLRSVLKRHSSAVTGCCVSADGRWLATVSNDRTFQIWEVTTRRMILRLNGHDARVTSCAFAPNRGWLATTSDDRPVRIWKPQPHPAGPACAATVARSPVRSSRQTARGSRPPATTARYASGIQAPPVAASLYTRARKQQEPVPFHPMATSS
jgi:WD40 repeat protein